MCIRDSLPVAQEVQQRYNERSLANSVGEGLNQIPAQPGHVENRVVADAKLEREEKRHCSGYSHGLSPVDFFDFLLSLVHLVKLGLSKELDGSKVEDLLFDYPFLEKLSGIYELVSYLVDGECGLAWSILLRTPFWFDLLRFDVGEHLVNKEVQCVGLESRHAKILAVFEPR